jgi:hypothetical protein
LPLILQNLDKNDPEREKSLTLFPQIVFFWSYTFIYLISVYRSIIEFDGSDWIFWIWPMKQKTHSFEIVDTPNAIQLIWFIQSEVSRIFKTVDQSTST